MTYLYNKSLFFNPLLLLSAGIPGWAQSGSPWQTTRLDSVASVRMPYAGTLDDELQASGITVFSTNTSDNEFDAIVFTPPGDPKHPLKPGQVWVPNVDQFLSQIMRMPDKSFAHAKLKTSFSVTLPSAPEGRATHQLYSGFDEFHQLPAALELTWVVVGSTLYSVPLLLFATAGTRRGRGCAALLQYNYLRNGSAVGFCVLNSYLCGPFAPRVESERASYHPQKPLL